jgi:hypothetical protein
MASLKGGHSELHSPEMLLHGHHALKPGALQAAAAYGMQQRVRPVRTERSDEKKKKPILTLPIYTDTH